MIKEFGVLERQGFRERPILLLPKPSLFLAAEGVRTAEFFLHPTMPGTVVIFCHECDIPEMAWGFSINLIVLM